MFLFFLPLELSEEELAAGSFDTEAIVIDTIDYVAADNAAVTYVPPYENKAKLIIESEDHTTRNEFVINLDGKGVGNTDPVYVCQIVPSLPCPLCSLPAVTDIFLVS